MRKIIVSLMGLYLLVELTSVAFSSPTASLATPYSVNEENNTLRFYLVRHGQTYSNSKHLTIGGGGNAQLTPEGRHNARCVGLGLKKVNFIAGYSSTLGRAYETANLILQGRHLTVTQIEALKDISWGDAEGGSIEDLSQRFGHSGNDFPYYFGDHAEAVFISPVHAENMYQFSQRFENALKNIASKHKDQQGNILIAAHSSMAFFLQKYRGDKPLAGLNNTSVSILEFHKGKFRLRDFNNTQYLTQGCNKEKNRTPLEIILVTNPLTILQRVGVIEGTTDSDFTPAGNDANQQLANQLISETFLAAYSSELGRGYKTAMAVLKGHPITPEQQPALNEIFLGHLEAEKIKTIKSKYAAVAETLFLPGKAIKFVSPDEGESGQHAAWRLDTFLSSVASNYAPYEGKVIVFTHPIIVNAFFNQRFPLYPLISSRGMRIITLQYKNEVFSVKTLQTIGAE